MDNANRSNPPPSQSQKTIRKRRGHSPSSPISGAGHAPSTRSKHSSRNNSFFRREELKKNIRDTVQILLLAAVTVVFVFLSEWGLLSISPKIENKNATKVEHKYRGATALTGSFDCSVIMRRCMMKHRPKYQRECTAQAVLCQNLTRPSLFHPHPDIHFDVITLADNMDETATPEHVQVQVCTNLSQAQLHLALFSPPLKDAKGQPFVMAESFTEGIPETNKTLLLSREEIFMHYYGKSNLTGRMTGTFKKRHRTIVSNSDFETLRGIYAKSRNKVAAIQKRCKSTEHIEGKSVHHHVNDERRELWCAEDQKSCATTIRAIKYALAFYEKYATVSENEFVEVSALFGVLYGIRTLFEKEVNNTIIKVYLDNPLDLWKNDTQWKGEGQEYVLSTMTSRIRQFEDEEGKVTRVDPEKAQVHTHLIYIRRRNGTTAFTRGGKTVPVQLAPLLSAGRRHRIDRDLDAFSTFVSKGASERVFQSNIVMALYFLTNKKYTLRDMCTTPKYLLNFNSWTAECSLLHKDLTTLAKKDKTFAYYTKAHPECDNENDALMPQVFSSAAVVEINRMERRYQTYHDPRHGHVNYVLGY